MLRIWLFDVITDYVNYPKFNPALVHVSVVRRDDDGAEFVADRKTMIGKRVHAHDRYQRGEDLVINRTYAGSASARSTWSGRSRSSRTSWPMTRQPNARPSSATRRPIRPSPMMPRVWPLSR